MSDLRFWRTIVAVGGAVCVDVDVITIARDPEQAKYLALKHASGVYDEKDVTLRDDTDGFTVEIVPDVARAVAIEEFDR